MTASLRRRLLLIGRIARWVGDHCDTARLLLVGLLVVFVSGTASYRSLHAQETQNGPRKVSEGYAVHHPTNTLYLYRIFADSTVYIRKGKSPKTDASITIPAHSLASIYQRVEKGILAPNFGGDVLALRYEDQYLFLQFSQRFDLYVLGSLIFLIAVGSAVLIWLWRRLSRERRRREALARSRRYLAEGREKERERLAQEIHDGPVQDLHGLHMRLKSLDVQPNGGTIEQTGDELMRVTGELRAMSADLHPPALQRFGLAAALRSHADRLRERYNDVNITIDGADGCPSFPDTFSLSVFRVAQEATNNAVQHGDATNIWVELECENETVHLQIEDDGEGFDPPADLHDLAAHDHYGLLGMQERADAIGAQLDIDSTPGNGTRIQLWGSTHPSTPANEPVHAPA